MIYVSLIFELLRSQPRLVFWLMTLAQALLWWLTPSLFYSAPPGDLALTLAIGHEFELGTYLGPPLSFWLSDTAFSIGGMPGVYLLAQICVIVTFWAVFKLACEIVGVSHAAIALMLMIGIFAFNIPTPEFGPSMLALPITAMLIWHFWRTIGDGRRGYWFAIAIETGLLLMTSYSGLIICLSVALFIAATRRGRAMLGSVDPWIAAIVVVVLMFPHLIWLDAAGDLWKPTLQRLISPEAGNTNWVDLVAMAVRIFVLHGGLIALVLLASGWRLKQRERVPVFLRAPVKPLGRAFVYYFAIVPLLIASAVAVIVGEGSPIGGTAPNVLLSGLAIVVLGHDIIHLNRQRAVGWVWGALLFVPPVAAVATLAVAPWITGAEFAVTQPAAALGKFFAENFNRRTGKPLEIVAGEPRIAALIALYSTPRASLYFDAAPALSPWISADDIRRKGAVVVWIANDTVGTPPPELKARFPDLAPDVPRAFERSIQGRTPLLRIGWGVLRPQAPPPAASIAAPPAAPAPPAK